MSITPLDFEPVGTHQSNAHGADVSRHGCRIEQGVPTHLLDAGGAGTREPERSGGIEAHMTMLVPFDFQAVVLAIDGMWDGVHGYWLLAIGYWLLAIGGK
jgi:hypothetical protein